MAYHMIFKCKTCNGSCTETSDPAYPLDDAKQLLKELAKLFKKHKGHDVKVFIDWR